MRSERGATLTRLLTAIPLLAVFALLIWVPQAAFLYVLAVAAFVAIGVREYANMSAARGIDMATPAVLIGVVALVLNAWFEPVPFTQGLVFTAGVLLIAVWHLFAGKHTLLGFAVSVLGLVYLGWLPATFVSLHQFTPIGPGLVTLAIVAVGLSDTGAYFVGSAIGRHKMAPAVSPKKSWEGAAGGLVFAVLGLGACYLIARQTGWAIWPGWVLWQFLLVGALLSVAGQIGDLVESMLKRDAGVKDSGSIFPGHGGVLDRCDGFIFAAPVLYYLVADFW
jgi:phosphatidate cytidylyltransferase